MKKLLVVLCAGAVVLSACSSAKAPVAPSQSSAPVKAVKHKTSGINCNK